MFDIIFLLDESTSMKTHIYSYIKLINTLFTTQKQINPYANLTIIKFASTSSVLCVDSKLHTIPEFTTPEHYNPRGITALYDAIGYAIDMKYNCNYTKLTMVFILTDGEDNNSKKHNVNTISEKIKFLKHSRWVFVFIAANQNAEKVGKQLAIDTCITYNETSKSILDIANVCNTTIGHALYEWTGISNEYCKKEIKTDIRDLTDIFTGFNI